MITKTDDLDKFSKSHFYHKSWSHVSNIRSMKLYDIGHKTNFTDEVRYKEAIISNFLLVIWIEIKNCDCDKRRVFV